MTGFDYIVLLIVAVAAIGGFSRGLVQEVLSLAAWILTVFAIRALHTPLTDAMQAKLGYTTTVSIMAFVLLLLIPYAAMKVIANNVSKASKSAVIGPIDRVLGFGFGGLKGVIIVVIAFSVLVLGYDDVWDYRGRPAWITTGRTYEFVDAGSRAMVETLAQRRAQIRATEAAKKAPADGA